MGIKIEVFETQGSTKWVRFFYVYYNRKFFTAFYVTSFEWEENQHKRSDKINELRSPYSQMERLEYTKTFEIDTPFSFPVFQSVIDYATKHNTLAHYTDSRKEFLLRSIGVEYGDKVADQ